MNFKKWGLQLKLSFPIALISTFILVVYGVYSYQTKKSQLTNELKTKLTGTMTKLKKSLIQPFLDMEDDAIVGILVGELKQEQVFVGFKILNEEKDEENYAMGKVSLDSKEIVDSEWKISNELGELFSSEELIVKPEDEDVGEPETMLGYIKVFYTHKYILEQLRKELIIIGLIVFLIDFSLIISIFIFLKVLAIKPLEKMANYAESLDINNLSGQELSLDRPGSNDELDNLARSFNDMRSNLKKAHDELQDYAENLEGKVRDATKTITEEKSKVSNLLNNMQQAVFLVDGNWNVIPPVSAHTTEVFKEDIIGREVFETIYKDMDKSSEDFADLQSAMSLIYGEDELQFKIVEDNLQSKLNYICNDEEEKTLSISYIPLYNEDDIIETIMMVIDDITDRERLEKEISNKKKESEKNIQIITEMANADLEEVEGFLRNSQTLVQSCLDMAKEAPSNMDVITEMFRFLHTLKGNSRVFNFHGISQRTHNAESQIMDIKDKVKEGEGVTKQVYENVIENLYDVSKEIMEVSGLAKKVFRIENRYEKFVLGNIFNNIIQVDDIICNLITERDHLLHSNEPFKQRKEIFEKVQKDSLEQTFVKELENLSHSIKANMKNSGGFENVVQTVDEFEKSLSLFEDIKHITVNDFSDRFIGKVIEIKDSIKKAYLESDLNHPLTHFPEDWSEVFDSFFNFSKAIDYESNTLSADWEEKLEDLNQASKTYNLTFFMVVCETLKKVLKNNDFSEVEKEVKGFVADLWDYMFLVMKLDSSLIVDVDEKLRLISLIDNIFEKSKEGKDKEVLTLLENFDKSSIFIMLLKKLISQEYACSDIFNEIIKKANYDERHGSISLFSDLVMSANFVQSELTVIKNDLKTSRIINYLPNKTKKLAADGKHVAKALKHCFDHNKRFTFLRLIDYYQLFDGFTFKDPREVGLKKAETWPVIVKNLKKLEKLIEGRADLEEIGDAFKRLKDIPILPNLSKFKTMVNDIAIKLSKNVKFSVKGKDISMDKDSYGLLQDGIVHILRNCLDHGIELPEDRTKIGKEGKGRIEIECMEGGDGNLKIIISDDGKGINPDIITQKAVEKGIYSEEKVKDLKDNEVLDIIFHPHFSQKEEVDELSGRGIGMDVVKKNLERIGGDILVESELGVGTTMTLTLNPGPPK